MKKNKLPVFRNDKEAAKFWDTHSLADYVHQMKDVTDLFTFAPELVEKIQQRAKKKMVAIRLANWEIEKAKEIAKNKKIPYQTLLREIIDIGLKKESLATTK